MLTNNQSDKARSNRMMQVEGLRRSTWRITKLVTRPVIIQRRRHNEQRLLPHDASGPGAGSASASCNWGNAGPGLAGLRSPENWIRSNFHLLWEIQSHPSKERSWKNSTAIVDIKSNLRIQNSSIFYSWRFYNKWSLFVPQPFVILEPKMKHQTQFLNQFGPHSGQ